MPVAFTEIGDLITRDPALHAGRPIIAGTGICVRTIAIESNRGLTPEEIAADRPPLSLVQIYAALAFYHANKQEIDADIAAEERAYDADVRCSRLLRRRLCPAPADCSVAEPRSGRYEFSRLRNERSR